jgi:hypothetical protein
MIGFLLWNVQKEKDANLHNEDPRNIDPFGG